MTLLEAFNDYQEQTYYEPDRKGVAKGEPIGVFRSTHCALLYSLYNYDEKEKAKRAGISYAFLRKLRTTDRFKQETYLRRLAFVDECFFTYLGYGHFYRYKPSPFAGYGEEIAINAETAFDDAAIYDRDAKLLIEDWLKSTIEKSKEEQGFLNDSQMVERLLDFLMKWNEPELNKNIYLSIVSFYSEGIKKLLSRKGLTEANRKTAMMYTNLIFEFSKTL